MLVEPRDYAWHFGALLIGRESWDGREVAKHWRAWAIKGFFGAFMISILVGGAVALAEDDKQSVEVRRAALRVYAGYATDQTRLSLRTWRAVFRPRERQAALIRIG